MYVVTGGAGFIGSNVLAGLEARGMGELVVCDRLRAGDKWRNLAKRELAEIVAPENLLAFLDRHSSQVDAVIHMGAISATTERDADLIIANNFTLTLALWDFCTRHQVRFIYASSAATYGGGEQGFDDDMDPAHLAQLRPLNPYGWSKHLFDRKVARLLSASALAPPQWAGLKFFNVYGPNEYHKAGQRSVVAQLYPKAAAGETARLFRSHDPRYPDGGQLRDFVWVGDCVEVILWLLDHPRVSGLFNVGTGNARAFRDLAAALYRALGAQPQIDYVDTPMEIRDKYQYFTEARMDRLRAAGYDRPFTPIEDGIAAYVQDFLARPDPYK